MPPQFEPKTLLQTTLIKSHTISISMKRSIRKSTVNGDEFRTAESHDSITLESEGGVFTEEDIKQLSQHFTPLLIKKVVFDLVVLGVMSREEAGRRIQYANKAYGIASKVDDDPGRDSSDLQGTGDTDNPAGEERPEGSDIPV